MADQPAYKAPAAEPEPMTSETPKTESAPETPGEEVGGSSTSAAIQPPAATHWTQSDYEDGFSETDSAFIDYSRDSTASISTSILEYRTIHGRTFHAQRGNADYWGPNDSRQNESMDITHHVCTMLLDDNLYLAPIEKVGKVLDVGTGTGIWAIDFADQHSESEVVGVDISPTQPSWVPPNLKFEIDDITQPWTYQPNSFDYVHIRLLFGSIPDWNALYAEAYKAIKPGGWVESMELSVTIQSDDGTVKPGMAIYDWGNLFQEAGRKMGKSMSVIEDGTVHSALKEAGFVDIQSKKYKVPFTGYAQDEKLRMIGICNHFATEEGLEGWALYILTHAMGWAPEQLHLFISRVRKELRLKKIHPWNWYEVIYARKPETA